MKKVTVQVAAAALVLFAVLAALYLLCGHNVETVSQNLGLPPSEGWQAVPEELAVELEKEGVARLEAVRVSSDSMEYRFAGLAPGKTGVQIHVAGKKASFYTTLQVNRGLFIQCDNTIIGGIGYMILAVGLFLAAVSLIFLRYFLRCRGSELYSYGAIFACGIAIFTAAGALGVLLADIRFLRDPLNYSILSALNSIAGISDNCMFYLAPLLLLFSVAMIVSNAALLRHEAMRPANILGIVIAVLMIAGLALPILVGLRGFSGSFEEYRLKTALDNIYATVYVYFACMLAGSVICSLRAVRHKVAPDRDCIIILGCGFNADGTLTPLLRGRCDRALALWKEQEEKTGKRAVFIPSGGQGSDEPMAEAEAMARYLLSCGVPEECIIREDRSRNTTENMAFSREIIEKLHSGGKTAFSTTNYHVFRSGILARRAGLEAEGIGARTKWWFWPNAFMREVVGLVASRVREEAVLLAITVAVSVLLTWLTVR